MVKGPSWANLRKICTSIFIQLWKSSSNTSWTVKTAVLMERTLFEQGIDCGHVFFPGSEIFSLFAKGYLVCHAFPPCGFPCPVFFGVTPCPVRCSQNRAPQSNTEHHVHLVAVSGIRGSNCVAPGWVLTKMAQVRLRIAIFGAFAIGHGWRQAGLLDWRFAALNGNDG